MKYFSIIHFRSRDTTVCLPVCLSICLSVRCHREEKRTEDLLITRNEILVKVFRFRRNWNYNSVLEGIFEKDRRSWECGPLEESHVKVNKKDNP